MNPKVSIITINWNGKEDTAECLESLKRLVYPNYDVIVVDNASMDDSVEFLRERFSEVTYIENEENVGWTGGCNAGIEYAMKKGADYIFILNNDIVIDKDCLKELVKVAESDARIGFVGPRIRSYEEHEKILSPGVSRNYRTLGVKKGEVADRGQFKEVKDVNWIDDTVLLVKKSVIEKVGIHDPEYFMYGEDTDWCYRVKKAGFGISYVPLVCVWHKHSASSGGGYNSFVAYYQARNYLLFMRKHFSKYHLFFVVPFFYFQFIIYQSVRALYKGEWNVPLAMIGGMLWHIGLKNK